jgi:hypothetical protein
VEIPGSTEATGVNRTCLGIPSSLSSSLRLASSSVGAITIIADSAQSGYGFPFRHVRPNPRVGRRHRGRELNPRDVYTIRREQWRMRKRERERERERENSAVERDSSTRAEYIRHKWKMERESDTRSGRKSERKWRLLRARLGCSRSSAYALRG